MRQNKGSFGRKMMQALQLMWLVKRHVWDEEMLSSEEIRFVSLSIVRLCLCEGID